MSSRDAVITLLAAGAAAAVIVLALAALYGRFLDDEREWAEHAYGGSPQASELSPRDLADLHEEARRITGEAP